MAAPSQPPSDPRSSSGPSRRQSFPLFGAAALAGLAPQVVASRDTRPERARPRTRKRYIYVGTYTEGASESRGIYVFTTDRDGHLEPVQVVPDIPNPSWLTLGPQHDFLYATSEVSRWEGQPGGGVTAFAVDPATGELGRINDQLTEGMAVSSAVSANGHYLLVANYAGASYAVLPIRADGHLEPASDVFPVTGKGPNAQRQSEPHPHEIRFDPAGRFVFGVDLGTDKVWSWLLEPASGKLEPNELPYLQVASGSGPRHLAFDESGRFVYVIDELTSAITGFRYDDTRGTFTWVQSVSTVPPDFSGENYPAEIAVHPKGKFLYGSNRGHDSIVTFTIDQATGLLSPVGWESTQGENPRNFSIDPSGSLLLVANQDSDNIVAFRINSENGKVTPTNAVTSTPTPVCIAFGRLAPAGS